ncbi:MULTISPECIES: hypothetical protein [unclassified Roseovarius]|uniref:hypothetical protein n=1 Tax=unclassified Roseovarius TaxID=2614913 RepID=UPI00273D2E38|nr:MULTISPECIES: hypothetical protein [unclassified Roseovarius]
MTELATLQTRVAKLEEQLQARLGVRGKNLQKRLARAGRRLPRRVRRAGQVITRAEEMAAHPKLARLRDDRALDAAFREVSAYLRTVDPVDRRKGIILGILGSAVFNLILLLAAILLLMRWQGFI